VKDRKRIDDLEARLAERWREREGPPLDSAWKAGVMGAVRAEASAAEADARVVRNALMLATAVAASVAAFFVFRSGAWDPSLELARVLVGDPQSLLQLLLVL